MSLRYRYACAKDGEYQCKKLCVSLYLAASSNRPELYGALDYQYLKCSKQQNNVKCLKWININSGKSNLIQWKMFQTHLYINFIYYKYLYDLNENCIDIRNRTEVNKKVVTFSDTLKVLSNNLLE